MAPNPFVGLMYHWIGGLAAASFYIPYKLVRSWAWETYWLVGGFFSWIVAPLVGATLLVPNLWQVLSEAPGKSVGMAYFWGVMWGLGGLTFGLSMRYLGIALGYAIALGLCTAFGTLMPPIFDGTIGDIASNHPGQVVLAGIGVCLLGIVFSGAAGMSKEREMSENDKKGAVSEFNFPKGLLVATFAGVMSAAFAYGLAAGKPIAEIARLTLEREGGSDLWQNLPVLVIVMLGGFTTNFLWCVALNVKNRTGTQYVSFRTRDVAEIDAAEAVMPFDLNQLPADENAKTVAYQPSTPTPLAGAGPRQSVPLLANYAFAAAAGVIWYLQFFFYSMGETRMGKDYGFSSWTLHMASIIIFSTLWGVALKEWKGTSVRTKTLVALGLAILVGSTVIVGYGNFLKAQP